MDAGIELITAVAALFGNTLAVVVGAWLAARAARAATAAKLVISHGRYVAFQMAEVAIPGNLFADILCMIAELRPPPVISTA